MSNANKCARLSCVQKSKEHNERRLVEALDRRSKNGKADEDAVFDHMQVNENGDRVWNF